MVTAALAKNITSGEWAVGSVIPTEHELAESFGVSRSAIRESLRTLKAKGIVESRQKAGTRVLPRFSWNMLDGEVLAWILSLSTAANWFEKLMQVRMIVEPAAAAVAAEVATDNQIAAIERAYRQMDAAGSDVEAFREPDLEFHRAVLSATQNEFLIAFGHLVEASLSVSMDASTRSPGAPRRSLGLHRKILDGIWERDPERARTATVELLTLTERNIKHAYRDAADD